MKATNTSAPLSAKAASKKTAPAAGVAAAQATHEQIAKRAYELYLARGSVEGHHEEDWLLAEAELASK